jgi:hypothetical protein
MGNAFGCLTLSDLEKATSSDVGLFVGKIGPDYKKNENLPLSYSMSDIPLIRRKMTAHLLSKYNDLDIMIR